MLSNVWNNRFILHVWRILTGFDYKYIWNLKIENTSTDYNIKILN
jgi:hypothetical protein